MGLLTVDIQSPREMRGGWAAHSAIVAAGGDTVHSVATANQWVYDDGAGNLACLRFHTKDKLILIGNGEASVTYFKVPCEYQVDNNVDLLFGAPEWWGFDLNPRPFGDWIGFLYGWDGKTWQRADYEEYDGYKSVGLEKAFSVEELCNLAEDDELGKPENQAVRALIDADADITDDLLRAVVPKLNIGIGVETGRSYLRMPL